MNDAASQPTIHVPAAPLTAIMQAIASGLDIPLIFDTVAQQAQQILTYDTLVILLRPPVRNAAEADGTGELTVAFSTATTLAAELSLRLSDLSFGQALLANHPTVVTDFAITADRYAGDHLLLENGGRASVILPIAAAPNVLGALVLISDAPNRYSTVHVPLVEPVASLLAVALEHKRLDERARTLAVVEERNRIAREIHDTLAQSLAGIIINLESLKPYGEERSGAEADVLAETETLARGALEEARRSVMGLHPTPLQHQSLRDALALELSGLAKRANVTTHLYVDGIERPLTPDMATALFRIAQEAFQNIYKHAAARHVILGLAFEERSVVLTVEDDGVGFVPSAPTTTTASTAPTASTALYGEGTADATALNNGGGFGLMSMATRAHITGGQLLVTSYPGHGTAVRATVPYTGVGEVMPAVVLPASPPEAEIEAHPSLSRPGSPEIYGATNPIRVLIVDDHSVVRQGIRRILEGQADIEVVGEAEDGLAAVEQAARLHPGVVLLDLQLPGMSGIEALPRLRSVHHPAEVVILTVLAQAEEVFEALKAGARGYLLKDATPASVLAAVRGAGRGESSLAPALATRVMDRFADLARREVDPDALTEREAEILGYMAQGLPYKQIGTQLNITAKTVQYHVRNILQKLHAGSRGEAVAIATQRGLLGRA